MDVSSDTWTLVRQLSPRCLVVPRVPPSHRPAFPRETSLLLELYARAHGICLTPDPDPRATVCPLRVECHLTTILVLLGPLNFHVHFRIMS